MPHVVVGEELLRDHASAIAGTYYGSILAAGGCGESVWWGVLVNIRKATTAFVATIGMSLAFLAPVSAAEGPSPGGVTVRPGFLGAWDIVVSAPAGERLFAPRVNVRVRVLDSAGEWLVADWDACSAFAEGSRCYANAYVFKPLVSLEVPYEFSVRIRGEGTDWGPWSDVQALPVWKNSLLPDIPIVGNVWRSRNVATAPIANAVGEARGCIATYTWPTRKDIVVAKVREEPGCGEPRMAVVSKKKRTWRVIAATPPEASAAERRAGVRQALTTSRLPRQAIRDAGSLVTIGPAPQVCSSSTRCTVSSESADQPS